MTAAVLVVGGAGYVGSHVTRRILEDGVPIVLLDDLSTGHAEVVSLFEHVYGPHRMAFQRTSLLDRDAVADVADRHDVRAIVDTTGLMWSISLPERLADLPSVCSTATDPPTANPDTQRTVIRYGEAAGADPTRLLGEQHDPQSHLVPLLLRAALSGARIHVPGGPTRCLVSVNDLADAHVRGLHRLLDGGTGEAITLGQIVTLSAVVEACERVAGRTINVETDHDGDQTLPSSGHFEQPSAYGATQSMEEIVE